MSSPWGKIAAVEKVNFAEIMSEEYAWNVHKKEIKKYEKDKVGRNENEKHHLSEESVPSGSEESKILYSEVLNIPIELEAVSEENVWSALLNKNDDKLPQTNENNLNSDIPDYVIDFVWEDANELGCDSDSVIAQMLQLQYNQEYNEELKRIEKQKNKDSKISISLDKYRHYGDFEVEGDNKDQGDGRTKGNWDRFETNEKLLEGIPKCGFKVDKEGEMITKHDAQLCGVRNACRVMSFAPELHTGDAAGFEMKLSNRVFNELKSHSRRTIKKSKMNDRVENVATAEMGVDASIRLLLYKLINKQILEQINGIISTGKEAVILHANSDPSYIGDDNNLKNLPKECAIKIFKTTLNEFKQRDRYIKDDYRFKDRFSKQNNRVIINMWAEKEMHNLMCMKRCGISCPDVVVLKKNILVMSFIGSNHRAAPKLKDSILTEAELICVYHEIIDMMYKMYNDAKLVHADLSEYNILWYDGKCWFIDVAQSVEHGHPSALEFLMRDCDNIINFFTKRGLPNIFTKEQLFEKITSLNAETHNAAMLERIHTRGANIKEATLPDQIRYNDEEEKLISYPFDLAWEKAESDRKLVETADAMKVLNIKTISKTKK